MNDLLPRAGCEDPASDLIHWRSGRIVHRLVCVELREASFDIGQVDVTGSQYRTIADALDGKVLSLLPANIGGERRNSRNHRTH